MKTKLQELLEQHSACSDAVAWVGEREMKRAWAECQRGDWMLWICAKIGIDRKVVVLAACACARTALKHVEAGETRPLKAIETAEAWCRGEATIEEVRDAAAFAANAAAFAANAAAYAAAYAAYAAADAAYAAADAAAYAAAYAADAAADAAYAAAYAARKKSWSKSAEIVRKMIPWKLVQAAAGGEGKK